ncbi:MAG: sce7725 family protein [Bacteroidota bacterium]
MYFPYIRGKQFDLIAIRELAERIHDSGVIHPVIEAVRDSSTLRITLNELVTNEVAFTIIANPSLGDFQEDHQSLIQNINSEIGGCENCNIGILLDRQTDLDHVEDLISEIDHEYGFVLIHLHRYNNLEDLENFASNKNVIYNLYKEAVPIRRYRRIVDNDSKVILADKFNTQRVNADYAEIDEEFFTEEHLYFEEDGFAGFSDYLTIGDDYSESGFAPYAVAIHLTYQNDDEQIMIRHFVSDSNEDYSDVAGKYGEALRKLIDFINDEGISTEAANEFREHLREDHYPGLGSVKKLSIQHHLELMISILA